MTDICKTSDPTAKTKRSGGSSNNPPTLGSCINSPEFVPDCNSPSKVCGVLSISAPQFSNPGPVPNKYCKGVEGDDFYCNSSSEIPWFVGAYTPSGLDNNPAALCAVLPLPLNSGFTENSGFCYAAAIDNPSDIKTNISNSLSAGNTSGIDLNIYDKFPLDSFTDEKNVQLYFETFLGNDIDNLGAEDFKFNSDQYGNKIMPFFCQQESKTGCGSTGYTKCSNFISSTLCKEWVGKSFSNDPTGTTIGNGTTTGLYQSQVADAMSGYCNNSSTNPPPCSSGSSVNCPGRDGEWVDECQCLNSDKDPVYNALNTGDPISAACWYKPCEPLNGVGKGGNENFLQSPKIFPGVTNTGICPSKICEAITLNFDKSNLNEKNVSQNVTCSTTKNAAGKTNNSITSVFSKNKGWIIGLTVGAVVLLILIIAIVILTRSHHTKKKPTLQQQLAEFEP